MSLSAALFRSGKEFLGSCSLLKRQKIYTWIRRRNSQTSGTHLFFFDFDFPWNWNICAVKTSKEKAPNTEINKTPTYSHIHVFPKKERIFFMYSNKFKSFEMNKFKELLENEAAIK